MPIVPAVITVNFVSMYNGLHRVCWRLGSSGSYDCTTIVNCSGNGSQCSAQINVSVNTDACEDIIFEGYVQAACEPDGSLNNRIPFTLTYVPNPNCMQYNVRCESTTIMGIIVVNAGSGYDPLNPPTVTIAPTGLGSGATATAVVDPSGIISNIVLTNPGSGYNSIPTVQISPPVSGTQAILLAELDFCEEFSTIGCSGNPVLVPKGTVGLFDTLFLCSRTGTPSLPSSYSADLTENNCSCDCYNARIENTDTRGSVSYAYNQCNGAYIVGVLTPSSTIDLGCISNGTLVTNAVPPGTTYLISNLGQCQA